MLLHFSQKFPPRWPVITLVYRATMHRDRSHTHRVSAVKNLEELFATFLAVVDPSPHLKCHRHRLGNRVAHSLHDFEGNRRLTQMVAPPTTPQHFLHRAAKVDVDHIEPAFHQPQRGRREILGIGTHQLPRDRVFLLGHHQEMSIPAPRLQFHDELIQQHFAKRVRSAVATCDEPHRHVAVPRKCRLHHRKIQPNLADA